MKINAKSKNCILKKAKDKPAVGFLKRTDSNQPFRRVLKRKDIRDKKPFKERVKGKQLLKEADSRINNIMPLDELNQTEACQADKILDDIAMRIAERLACLSQFNYEQKWKEEARRLDIRISTLENAVKKARKLYTSAKSTSTEPEQPDLDY